MISLPTSLRRKPSATLSRTPTWEPWLYLVLLGISEYVANLWQPIFGIWMHVLLVVLLVARGSRQLDEAEGRFYVAISIMPMVRIVSFAMSPQYFPGTWYYVSAEIPLLAAAIAAAKVLGLPRASLGWVRPKSLRLSGLAILSGLAVGFGERFIIQPRSLVPALTIQAAILPAVLLIISTGVVEETVFRGLIQSTATRWIGTVAGISFTTIGWGLLHIGWGSAVDVAYVTAVGVLWGYLRHVNKSTIDLGVAHGVANVMLFIVLPHATFGIP